MMALQERRGVSPMSIIHVGHIKSTCEKRFHALVDISDQTNASAENRENYFLTRALAAFSVAELAKVDDHIAAAAITDESGDDGIDAFYFDRIEHVCYLVQSKWIKSGSGTPDLGEILKFVQGVNHLLEGDKIDTFGAKLKAKKQDIQDVLSDSQATFVIVVAYTGQQLLSKDVKKPLEELLSALNDDEDLVSLQVMAQKELHKIVSQHALGESVDLTILLHEYGQVREPFKAYYGQVDLSDIVSWGKFGDHLYAKNLRGFKGSTDVNEGIVATIKNAPENFLYFNNGITILCSELIKQPLGGRSRNSGVFECKGASVVNGAQTVGSIVSARSLPLPDGSHARVLVRLLSLEKCPEGFASEITRAANTQNKIEKRDFAALDEQQARIKTDLFLSYQKEYVYRTGDAPPLQENGCTLDEATVALACAQLDINYTMLAKREVSKLYEDIRQAPYVVLFNPSVSALRLWRSVEVMRVVDGYLREAQGKSEGRDRLIAIHGNRFILHLVFQDIGPSALDHALDGSGVQNVTRKLLQNVINATGQLFPSAYPSNLFKNVTKCKALAASVNATAAG